MATKRKYPPLATTKALLEEFIKAKPNSNEERIAFNKFSISYDIDKHPTLFDAVYRYERSRNIKKESLLNAFSKDYYISQNKEPEYEYKRVRIEDLPNYIKGGEKVTLFRRGAVTGKNDRLEITPDTPIRFVDGYITYEGYNENGDWESASFINRYDYIDATVATPKNPPITSKAKTLAKAKGGIG